MKHFQSFRLDTVSHSVWRGSERLPLTPKAFDVLRYLVEHAGRLVTPDQLLEALWPDTYVNQEVLRKYILEIRRALGDKADEPQFIETIPKRGYRFAAAVTEENVAETIPTESGELPVSAEPARPDALDAAESKRSPDRKAWAGLLLAMTAAVLYFASVPSRKTAQSPAEASLVVLPFRDLSPNKDQEYFCDSLTEELISNLAKNTALKVVARSSAFQFKGKNEDLRVVGKTLGVANVLEGSIRKDGDRVRITTELTKADDGFQLWAETYDRDMKHIFATQDDIARAVTVALQAKLLAPSGLPESPNTRGTSPEAYQAYLQGQYFSARGQDKDDLSKALYYANQAIHTDEYYAPAWSQRAQVLQAMASVALIDNTDGYRQARESAERAIELDPKLAAGYLALGMVQINHDFDWEGADNSLKKAAVLAPESVEVVRYRAYLARTLGRVSESIEFYNQAIALDPLRANFHLALGYELYLAKRFREAKSALQRAEELNPQLSSLHLSFGKILLAEGQSQEAVAEIEKETGDWERTSGEALAYHALGHRQDSDVALNKLIANHQNDSAYQIAEIYAYRGEIDNAFEWLGRAYRQHDPGMQELKTGLLVESLRKDPRYAEFLNKMRLHG
jgi:TolB-like protein/DNA-binding winged helix-turn-helix (wHTH) protein/Flp pilus assembly protein TadD